MLYVYTKLTYSDGIYCDVCLLQLLPLFLSPLALPTNKMIWLHIYIDLKKKNQNK